VLVAIFCLFLQSKLKGLTSCLFVNKIELMATIRDLKKTINYELSSVIEECYVWQLTNADHADKAEKIIDEAIETFDNLIVKVNDKSVENKKAHFNGLTEELYKTSDKLMKKLVKL